MGAPALSSRMRAVLWPPQRKGSEGVGRVSAYLSFSLVRCPAHAPLLLFLSLLRFDGQVPNHDAQNDSDTPVCTLLRVFYPLDQRLPPMYSVASAHKDALFITFTYRFPLYPLFLASLTLFSYC